MALTLVITGRPNVGKSTLFNRLVGRRHALVDETPGLTRDWREGEGRIGPLRFTVIDTAGLERTAEGTLGARMARQTERALAEADLVLFLVDGKVGVMPEDEHFAAWLRRRGRPVILVVNKAEGKAAAAGVVEAYRLGLGDPVPISALNGEGMDGLYDALAPFAAGEAEAGEGARTEAGEAPLRLAVIGRPNVGKSTLFNAILKEERAITSPEPGTTRDAVVVAWSYRGMPLRLIDTAGLRRRPKVHERPEKLAAASTLQAVRFAHIVVLVIDAERGIERQDLALAALIEAEGRAPVIALNKWDRVGQRRAALKAAQLALEEGFPQGRGAALVPLSALTGEGVEKLMPAVVRAYATWNRRVATGKLNRWLAAMTARHPPPQAPGARVKLRYLAQVNTRPPTFALFLNRPAKFPEAYRRYLVNGLREAFALPGVPIRLMLRKGENPFAAKGPGPARAGRPGRRGAGRKR